VAPSQPTTSNKLQEQWHYYLKEAEILACLEDGAADHVPGAGEVDDGEIDGGSWSADKTKKLSGSVSWDAAEESSFSIAEAPTYRWLARRVGLGQGERGRRGDKYLLFPFSMPGSDGHELWFFSMTSICCLTTSLHACPIYIAPFHVVQAAVPVLFF
jgi:hypothetical protein